MAIEDEFQIELPDKDAEEILTPRQAIEKVFYILFYFYSFLFIYFIQVYSFKTAV